MQKNPDLSEEILKKLEELEQRVNVINNRLEEIEEDLTYTVELIMKYQQKVERSSRTETITVYVLLFTVGVLLGFALALLFIK